MDNKEEIVGGGGGSAMILPCIIPAAASKASRQRFTVELRPGETTFVSWKKLIKDSNKLNPSPIVDAPPPTGAHPSLESRIAPGQNTNCELKDEPPSNRYSAVIEKIERLYMGKQSSDEEELGDVPDDDQYDTEDSFIDDAELDQYFQVDKSTTKHNGFFVNKGKLERTSDLVLSPNHQPKKRRKKYLMEDCGGRDSEHIQNKHAKMGNARTKNTPRNAPLLPNSPSESLANVSDHFQDEKSKYQPHAPVVPIKKKLADPKAKLEHSLSSKLERDDSGYSLEAKDHERQKLALVQSRGSGNKLKGAGNLSDATNQMYKDSSTCSQLEPQCRKLLDTNEQEPSTKVQHRGKIGGSIPPGHPVRVSKNEKIATMPVREGSSVRSKGTILERAIRELEIIVSESRPHTMENHDADTSSQGVKRRLPREVKQKLAKVARLAQSSQGKISDELVHRLMNILGHIMQLKTLKRNLKAMVELGLSAKQEKHDRFQKIKKEVIEMIKTQTASSKTKGSDQQDGTFDDLREVMDSEEKGSLKEHYSIDIVMEDKICELYDLYVEGMDEDKGPQIRKLYVEIAELWPSGSMDNHGIKNAVCRAKERKRALGRLKEKETIKRKKLSSTSRTEEIVTGEGSAIAQPRAVMERMASDNSRGLTSPSKTTSTLTITNQQLTSERISGSSMDWLKQEKVKHSSSAFLDKARKRLDGVLMKKKVKRKPESDSGNINLFPEKLSSQQAKERQKSQKQVVSHPPKSSHQLPSHSGSQQAS